MKLKNFLKDREIYCAHLGQYVADVAKLMDEKNIGAVPVLDGDKLVGIFSERDLLKRVVAQGKDPASTRVDDVMTREIMMAPYNCHIKECIAMIQKYQMRHIPIVENDKLVGFISLRDLLQFEMEDKDFEIKVLHEYIHYIPPTETNK